MMDARVIEAYCETCEDPTEHKIAVADPGTCTCASCGTMQQLMVPVA